MMIRTAGGPGAVSPLDFTERRTPRLSRASWIAIGLVAAAHVGVGVALYYQRFELTPAVQPDPGGTITVTMTRPTPPKPVEREREPPPPNMPLNEVVERAPSDVEPLAATPNENARLTESTTVTVTELVEETPVEDVRPTQPEPGPRVIRNPSWARQPSGDQLMRAYPDRALARGVAGSVTLNCMVEANGEVSSCSVASETPAGEGFGQAGQRLARYFRINPRTVDGTAEGSRVSINLRFVPPAD